VAPTARVTESIAIAIPPIKSTKGIVQPTAVLVPKSRIEHKNIGEEEGADGDKAEGTDLRENFL